MKELEKKEREEEREEEKKTKLNEQWPQDAQDELQDFIESQGIYIRQ